MNNAVADNCFCVILSKYRLIQVLALYRSLDRNIKQFALFILCLDKDVFDALEKLHLRNVNAIPVNHIESAQLNRIKQQRKMNEYCWTLKPVFIEYLFDNYSEIGRITYLDGDLYFFSDLRDIFDNTPGCSVLLSKHDYSNEYAHLSARCGKYNSGFISFKREKSSINCLKWWKGKCLGWCRNRSVDGRYGDQKYLDRMPLLSSRVCSISLPGANIAPWNQSKYNIKLIDNSPYLNSDKLIFYHFCGFRLLNKNDFTIISYTEQRLVGIIYKPYIIDLSHCMEMLEKNGVEYCFCIVEDKSVNKETVFKLKDFID